MDRPKPEAVTMGFYNFLWARPLGHVVYYLKEKIVLHASARAGRVVEVTLGKFWSSPSRVRLPTTGANP